MPFRNADVVPSCADCAELAFVECTRCFRPLCKQHGPPKDGRCIECESQFLAKGQRRASNSAIGAVLLAIGCGVTLAIHLASYTAFIPTIGLSALLLAPFAAWTARAITPMRSRKAFLKERVRLALPAAKSPLLLPPGDSE